MTNWRIVPHYSECIVCDEPVEPGMLRILYGISWGEHRWLCSEACAAIRENQDSNYEDADYGAPSAGEIAERQSRIQREIKR